MFVRKADGELEEFDQQKTISTCMRSGLTRGQSQTVLEKVLKKTYDKIPTKELLKIIIKEIDKLSVESALKYNLRAAVAKLCEQGMVFEKYVQKLLEESGFEVAWSQIIKGKCIEHEIDLVAKNGKKTIMVECKHHKDFHTYTGLGEALEVWAKFEDLNENGKKFDEAWLVCNTKASDHSIRYAKCKDVKLICWKFSSAGLGSLEQMVESKKLYPITALSIDRYKHKFYSLDVITLKDLLKFSNAFGEQEIMKKTGVQMRELKTFLEESKKLSS